MKRTIAVLLTLALVLLAVFASAESFTVGIGQFAEHGSLDNCRTGFIEGLASEGIVEGQNLTVLYENAQADMGITQQIAAQFAAKPVDLMVGIATPMAQACFNAADGKIPVIFNAVSDPIASGFVSAETASVPLTVKHQTDCLPERARNSVSKRQLPLTLCTSCGKSAANASHSVCRMISEAVHLRAESSTPVRKARRSAGLRMHPQISVLT